MGASFTIVGSVDGVFAVGDGGDVEDGIVVLHGCRSRCRSPKRAFGAGSSPSWTQPSRMFSAWAGTSRSTVSALTSSRGFWRRKPEIRYSLLHRAGAGTMALKVVAGSVPMATATSMRSSRIFATVIALRDSHDVAAVVPPAVRAIRSTLPARSAVVARRRSRRCSAATFWRCQCMPVVLASYTCMRYMPTLRLPVCGSRVMTQGRVMKGPPSCGAGS